MIVISCRHRDESFSSSEIEKMARDAFPHRDNASYLDAIAQRKNESSRADSFFALCLLSSMCEKIGEDKASLSLDRDKSGRPYFKSSELDFSVSHSSGTVAVALSDRSRVGIDLELNCIDTAKAQKLADRYFTAEEAAAVKTGDIGGNSIGSVKAFRHIWTEKEAYAKMSGIPLADILTKDTPNTVYIHHLDVSGYPVTLCSSLDDEVRVI